jgi:hypothetical protein
MNKMKPVLAAIGIAAAMLLQGVSAEASDVTVYKSPSCGCCGAWVTHLRANGFSVAVEDVEDLAAVKQRLGVPAPLQSCHTATVDGYVVEGHVPAVDIRRLLTERPGATGLAVPGMPIGSPGMEQADRREPYVTTLFGPDGQSIYARH